MIHGMLCADGTLRTIDVRTQHQASYGDVERSQLLSMTHADQFGGFSGSKI